MDSLLLVLRVMVVMLACLIIWISVMVRELQLLLKPLKKDLPRQQDIEMEGHMRKLRTLLNQRKGGMKGVGKGKSESEGTGELKMKRDKVKITYGG